MTLLQPNLQLRKLRVLDGVRCAYAADFHSGVNIISGQNASGKSTVVDFIFYVLGGDSVPWKNEALLCTDVVAELSVNGSPLTVRRLVNESPRNPMGIYWGNIEDGLSASFSEWQQYPYQRSSKESFSQVLFRLLGLPELKGEGASNITMHQLLRLMYVDQRTPHDQIFRAESFDTMLTRETVGNYLCGVFSDKLYDARLELKEVDAKLERSISDLRRLFAMLGKSGQGTSTSDFLRAEAASVLQEISDLQVKLTESKAGRRSESRYEGESAKKISSLRSDLTQCQNEYSFAVDGLLALQLENKDSEFFIQELQRRLDALDESEETRQYLGAVKFNFCPCCLSRVEDIVGDVACSLCKSTDRKSVAESQILRMRNELALQKAESQKLYEKRRVRIADLESRTPALKRRLRTLEKAYRQLVGEWVSPAESDVESFSYKIGVLNQRLEQISEYQRLADVVEGLQSERDDLEAKKKRLLDVISLVQSEEEALKDRIRLLIHDELIALLRADLPRQDEFISASAVDWDFGSNWVSVNGQRQFSESSMVVLKHCFHLALLAASAKDKFVRYPRFVLLDGIEDGGQETARSHALQHLILKLSESLPSEHQIIFATSQIAPELATNSLVVGRASTVVAKTLQLQ